MPLFWVRPGENRLGHLFRPALSKLRTNAGCALVLFLPPGSGVSPSKKTGPFQPTSKVRVVPRNRRIEMAREARLPRNIKVRTNIHIDLDAINFFKERAKAPGALPYQTQINAELRKVMEGPQSQDAAIDRFIRDEKLIAAIAERVREFGSLHREAHRESPAHRNSGAGRPARKHDPPGRA